MTTNYRVSVTFDAARKVFVASAPELLSCSAQGDTRAAALEALEDEIAAQIANMRDQGATPPIPVDELQPPRDDDPDGRAGHFKGQLDGRVSAKLSASLHRELLYLARAEGMPLDVLAAELLAESLALRSARELRAGVGKRDRDGNQRDGNRREQSQPGRQRDDSGRRRRERSSYTDIMQDKASFLEYVRGQEQSQQRGPRRRRGGGDKPDE